MTNIRTSYCGVTTGNSWMYNNPDLIYPDNHEMMSPAELRDALRRDESSDIRSMEWIIEAGD